MVYLEYRPAAPLNRFVRMLWYTRADLIAHHRERVLPNGCIQIVINLARDFLLDCPEDSADRPIAPAIVVGARSIYETVDSSDMADLAGIVFQPGGFAPFAREPADAFTGRSVSLEDVWGTTARALRDQLRETAPAQAKLRLLELLLQDEFRTPTGRNPIVDFALNEFARAPQSASIEHTARQTGWSVRHFSQLFREQVGLSPKLWCRIQRFQRAVRQLHGGVDVGWAELAVDCGYYDQSHFANDFRAFSGINPTTYCAHRTRWVNHIPCS